VHLPRAETRALVETATVRELAETFAAYLPVTIVVDLPAGGEMTITTEPPFLADDRDARIAYGRDLIGAEPLDAIALSVPATQTRGRLRPALRPAPSARQSTRVYLHRMLLTERADDILPDWAFFARAVIDSEGLHPTASRESLVDDDALEQTRRELGDGIRRWILELALHDPARLAQFVAIHEVALKSLVRHDDELARFIVRWLSVETTQGRLRIESSCGAIRTRYTETVDEFRQVASVADTSGVLVDGGYVYDADLVRLPPRLSSTSPSSASTSSTRSTASTFPAGRSRRGVALERRAAAALAGRGSCACSRTELPGLFVSTRRAARPRPGRAQRSGALWEACSTAPPRSPGTGSSAAASRLCLNWNNDLVRRWRDPPTRATAGDLERLRLLYVQSLLAGHHPRRGGPRAHDHLAVELLGHALRAQTDDEQGES
jgi:molecular chaperone HtpG